MNIIKPFYILVVKDLKGFCQFDKQCEAQFSTDAYCLNGSCECRESAHFNYDKKKCYRTKCKLTHPI